MPFAPFAEDFVPTLRARPSHRFTRPFICDYLTEAPRRIDNGEPDELESLASPFDPIVPPAPSREARLVAHTPLSPAPTVRPEVRKTPRARARAPVVQTYQPLTPEIYWGRPEAKRPAPIARPRQAPAAAVEPPYPAYLRQQFTKLQAPVTQQVGALSPPPGPARVPSGLGFNSGHQREANAYTQAQVNIVHHVRCAPPLRHPTPTRSTPPAWVRIKTPKVQRVPTPEAPDMQTLLQGMDVPTWEKLDEFAMQAREWLALRAALDPQGYAVRHNQVAPVGRSMVPDIALLEGLNIPTWADLDVIAKYLKEWFALRALLDPQSYTMRRTGTAPKVVCEEYGVQEDPSVAGGSQVEEWNFPTQGPPPAPSTVLSIPTQVLSEPTSEFTSDSHSFLSYRLAEQELALSVPIQSPDDSVKQLELMAKELDFRARAFVLPDCLDFIPYELHPAEYKGVPGMYQDSSNNEGFLEYSAFLDEAYDLLAAVPTWGYKSIQLPRKKLLDRVVDEENMLYRMRAGLWEMESRKQERLREMEKLKGLYWTSFPAPAPSPDQLNRPEQPAPALRTKSRAAGPTPVSPEENHLYYYFCIDDRLLYLSFFEDWGPLNLAQVYRACILIHELLQDANLKRHRIVLYSSNDPRRRANSALLMALYCMIVQRRTPWEVFYPIAEVEFMPFRDAGRGRSDFHLGIQDCLWGVWKAQHNHLLDMNEFSVDEYEYYEKVDNGDWNWITPGFIAFASPVDSVWIRQQKEGKTKPGGATSSVSALQRKLPNPFVNVLEYFSERNVKLVVRLNNELYDKAVFEERGIEHLDLYFDDGTNPADEITRTFIAKSDAIIEAGGAVAVHCKAGLGRTGTLIGAYLIYKYGFTASEAIGFMRIVRPGSVVGPQQQFMYMKQLEWAKWAAVDEIRKAEAQRVEVPTPRTPPEELHPMSTGSTNAASASPVRTGQSVAPSSPRAATPPGLMSSPVIATAVPVTPHRARPTTPIKTDGPVLQPRKTPAAKRAATGEEVEDEGDQLGVLGVGFRRVSGKRVAGGDAGSASRSEVGSRVRREGAVGSSSKSDSGPRLPAGAMSVDRGKSTGIGLGRATRSSTRMVAKRAAEIEASLAPAPTPQVTRPRLMTHATTANGAAGGVSRVGQATAALKNASTRHAPSSSVSSVPGNTRRPVVPPGSPQLPKYNTRSKLPLPSAGAMGPTTTSGLKVPQKRAYVLTPPPPLPLPLLAEKGKKAGEEGKEKEDEDPEWMHGEGANAVVVPGSKLERPNLRSVRRRRSSFSAADIIT